MDYISLLLLMAFGGSCGGFASGIAQNNENNSYEIRVPFLRSNNNESRLVPLGILGNIIIGATASVSIFFIAVPLFNLKIPATTSANQLQWPSVEDQAKLFSLSVAAGFAGINLMESMARRITSTVSEKEEYNSKHEQRTEKTIEPNGKVTETTEVLSQQKDSKALTVSLEPHLVNSADNSANNTSVDKETFNHSASETTEGSNGKSMLNSSK
ncbi:MAG: hypothetical protein ACYTXA_12660 [Nostoc sp.]